MVLLNDNYWLTPVIVAVNCSSVILSSCFMLMKLRFRRYKIVKLSDQGRDITVQTH